MVTDKQTFISTMKKFHPESTTEMLEKSYLSYCELERNMMKISRNLDICQVAQQK